MEWWRAISDQLARGGVLNAAAGAVAANAYMPPRQTAELDLIIQLNRLMRANELLTAAGWEFIRDLDLFEGLEGSAWRFSSNDARQVDVIGLPNDWGRAAMAGAQRNVIGGIPTLTLPFLVITKLISSHAQDTADLARMLGAANEPAREAVVAAVRDYRPQDLDDVEQLIELGELEFGV